MKHWQSLLLEAAMVGALGIQKTRSGASTEEMKQAFKGLGEGLLNRIRGKR